MSLVLEATHDHPGVRACGSWYGFYEINASRFSHLLLRIFKYSLEPGREVSDIPEIPADSTEGPGSTTKAPVASPTTEEPVSTPPPTEAPVVTPPAPEIPATPNGKTHPRRPGACQDRPTQ